MIFQARFVFLKIFELAVSLFLLVAASFLLLKIFPGGPFHDEVALHPVVRESLLKQWALDQPFFVQFLSYLKGFVIGDWGVSMIRPDQRVTEIIKNGFAATFAISFMSLVIVLLGSVGLSLVALKKPGSWIEKAVDQFALAAISLPSLFWGPFLIFSFGFYFDLLPIAFLEGPSSYVLPVLTLSFRPLGTMTRILKRTMEENYFEDYVRTATAKGLGAWSVLTNHVFRNSLIPYLAYLGPLLAGLFSGSFLVEILFSIPGLGSEFATALTERDYTVILGLTLFYGLVLLVANGVCEILIRMADPRIRSTR